MASSGVAATSHDKGTGRRVAGPVPENMGFARDLVLHAQSLAPLVTARGDDGATGARTHAQPEAVDLSATPVVRLKRTLAHLRLQGRVRKYIRQTPRICGVVHCLGAVATSPVSETRTQADQRHKHKKDTAWSRQGQIEPDHGPPRAGSLRLPRVSPRPGQLPGQEVSRGPITLRGRPPRPTRTRPRRTCGHPSVHSLWRFHTLGLLWITSACG